MNVHIMLQDQETSLFKSAWTLDLLSVPAVGSKLNYKVSESEESQIYEVLDVCHGDGQLCEVYVRHLCAQTDFHLRKF